MAKDKKFSGGQNCFVLPTALGKFKTETGVSPDLIAQVVRDCVKR
jgi:3-dehydroquinate synthetase